MECELYGSFKLSEPLLIFIHFASQIKYRIVINGCYSALRGIQEENLQGLLKDIDL